MRFVYNERKYEVMDMCDFDGACSMGLVLFEVQYCSYEYGKRVKHSEEEFLSQEDYDDAPIIMEQLRYINYFPRSSRDPQNVIEECEYFIDHEYDKDFDECKYLMRQVRNAQIELDNDIKEGNRTKSSLDALEYAQSDLYDYIRDNIEGEE